MRSRIASARTLIARRATERLTVCKLSRLDAAWMKFKLCAARGKADFHFDRTRAIKWASEANCDELPIGDFGLHGGVEYESRKIKFNRSPIMQN
jgi:hypothetical protein